MLISMKDDVRIQPILYPNKEMTSRKISSAILNIVLLNNQTISREW